MSVKEEREKRSGKNVVRRSAVVASRLELPAISSIQEHCIYIFRYLICCFSIIFSSYIGYIYSSHIGRLISTIPTTNLLGYARLGLSYSQNCIQLIKL